MITLIGHGYIGTHIAKSLKNFEWISHTETPSKNTDFIINATGYVGYPNVESCEMTRNLCMQANVLYPLSLEQRYDVPILHISSGCIYTGYPENGWAEDDEPNFTFDNGSFYNGCKATFEKLMTQYLSKSYVFRIRLPFCHTPNRKNLLYKYEKYNKLVDCRNSITSVSDLINVVSYFVNQRPNCGIYNVVNPGVISTKEIVDKMHLKKEWYTTEEFDRISSVKRSNCSLSTKKLCQVYKIPSIDDALHMAIFEYKRNTI
jgi:dTDP-4-dehydrorhamnose reductase